MRDSLSGQADSSPIPTITVTRHQSVSKHFGPIARISPTARPNPTQYWLILPFPLRHHCPNPKSMCPPWPHHPLFSSLVLTVDALSVRLWWFFDNVKFWIRHRRQNYTLLRAVYCDILQKHDCCHTGGGWLCSVSPSHAPLPFYGCEQKSALLYMFGKPDAGCPKQSLRDIFHWQRETPLSLVTLINQTIYQTVLRASPLPEICCPLGELVSTVSAAVQDPCADTGAARREHPGYGRRGPEQQAGRRQHNQYSFWHGHACSLPRCAGTHRHPLGALPCHLCRGLLSGL